MAQGFLDAGAAVAICSRHKDDLEDACRKLQTPEPARLKPFVADLSVREETLDLAASVLGHFGRVDILVNNAGTNLPEPIDAVTDANWDLTLELNLTSAMALMRALVPQMKDRRWGRIIHISSVMGLASKAGRNSYSASKAALIGLAKANALDLAPWNITVNCIAPGPFLSELTARVLNPEQRKIAADRTALKRWGDPSELVGPALLLASDAGSYMTGSVLLVDGGLMCQTF